MPRTATKRNGDPRRGGLRRGPLDADALAGQLTSLAERAAKDVTLGQYAQLWMAGREGTLGTDLNEPLAPYQQSLWVYRCVSEIQKTGSGIPLRLMRGGEGAKYHGKSFAVEIRRTRARTLRPVGGRKAVCVGRAAEGEDVESGPAHEFLIAPNSYQDWPAFFRATIGFWLLRGKVAWVMTDLTGRRPKEMHAVDGRHVSAVFGRDSSGMPVLEGYKYRVPKTGAVIPLAVDEVKYFNLWTDSDNPFAGMAMSIPGRLAIATDYNASLFNASALVNGAEPGIVLEFAENLTPEQRDDFRAELRQRNQGPARAKRELILEGGAKASAFQSILKDLQFDKGAKRTRLEICCLYGVPPVVAGWVDAAGDSSAYTSNALQQFYQQTAFPMLDGFIPAIQEIVSRFDGRLVVYFDVEDQPVVQEMRLARLESAERLFKMSYPPNAINDALALGMPAVDWGDVGFLPSGLLPAADVASGEMFGPVNEGPSEPGSDELDQPPDRAAEIPVEIPKAAVDRIWTDWYRSWSPIAKALTGYLRTRYLAQQRRVITLLNDLLPAGERSAVKQDEIVARILFEVFSNAADRKRFRVRARAYISDANELGVRQALAEGGLTDDALEQAATGLLADRRIVAELNTEAVRISTLIDNRTRGILKRQLSDGLSAGEDVRHLADRVQAVMGNRRAAAMSVSRNAVGQTLSRSRYRGQLAVGATHKVWIHSRGPGERREAHVAAEAVYAANPVPMTEPFVINGVPLMYPRDHSAGHPEETINCQCLHLARRLAAGAGAADLISHYLMHPFLTLKRARQIQGFDHESTNQDDGNREGHA